MLGSGEWLSWRVHRLIGSEALAREYDPAEMSPRFRTNGNTDARSPEYRRHVEEGFANWRLTVDGLVERPLAFTLAELKSLPARSQITRHDCVEGWSAIGKWTGTPLGDLLEAARLRPRGALHRLPLRRRLRRRAAAAALLREHRPRRRFPPADDPRLGDERRPSAGRPRRAVRLRVERQLGYKHAKFVMRVEAVASLDGIGQGKGGFWEDTVNYDWYAGI